MGKAGARNHSQRRTAVDSAARYQGYPRDINPNTFAVGHPASPSWIRPHANYEHPAVLQAARARRQVATIDTNSFIVQPAASVCWLDSSDEEAIKVAAAR